MSGKLTADRGPQTAENRPPSAVCRLFLFLTLIFLASCSPAPEFDAINPGGDAPGAMARRPAAVSFVELDANPLLYRNTLVRVTGAYAPSPEPPCTPYKGPPASWSLVDSGLRLDVQGFSEVMELIAEGSQVTVDGFWERYEGPVGCGKEPPTQTLWYLRAVQLVQPNPLPELAGLPGDASASEEGAPTPDLEATAVPTTTPTPRATDDLTPTPTPTARVTATPTTTPDLTVSPTATLESDVTPSATPTPTPTSDGETTPQPGGTGEPGATLTPTPGGDSPPAATSTPSDYPPPDATPTPDSYG